MCVYIYNVYACVFIMIIVRSSWTPSRRCRYNDSYRDLTITSPAASSERPLTCKKSPWQRGENQGVV